MADRFACKGRTKISIRQNKATVCPGNYGIFVGGITDSKVNKSDKEGPAGKETAAVKRGNLSELQYIIPYGITSEPFYSIQIKLDDHT
jgi:hypothetical protein